MATTLEELLKQRQTRGGGAGASPFMGQQTQARAAGSAPTITQGTSASLGRSQKDLAKTVARTQAQFAPELTQTGFQTLLDILQSGGRTDPAAFNLELADISRAFGQAGESLQGRLGAAGLTGSGLGRALGASLESAGGEALARRRAQENQLAEERRRSDLGLLQALLLNPAQDIGSQLLQARLARAAQPGLGGQLLTAGLGAAGAAFGGPVGAGIGTSLGSSLSG